jgi:4-amino-4-deoxy-L-arabinose transferase-like glycosyltransferase
LRGAVARSLNLIWHQNSQQPSQTEPTTAGGEIIYDKIQALSPQNDVQRALKAQASSMAVDLGKLRWLMFEQGSTSVSLPLLAVLVFWLAIVFTSFGRFAPPNVTVIATLFLCALSVSGAIFLILAMYKPFQGLMQVSSAPLRNALAHLGQ